MASIINGNRLHWRPVGDGYSLHLDRRTSSLLHVLPDATYAGMWRIAFADGSQSDMTNLSRAKDAGRQLALAALHRDLDSKETASEAPSIAPVESDDLAEPLASEISGPTN